MGRAMMLALGCMILLTVIGVWENAYQVGFFEGRLKEKEAALLKVPWDYGVTRSYHTIKLDNEPTTWHTAEELGIALIRSDDFDDWYWIYIISGQEEKALDWMTQPSQDFTSPVVKYGDEFYEFGWLWVTPGLDRPFHLRFQISILLALGWGIFVPFAYALSRPQPPQNQE